MATSNGLDESESDAQRDHSRAARLLRGTRYKCATGWRLLERILLLLCGKSRWLLYHRRFLWQVVLAALRSRGAKFIPSLEGRGFLWQFCKVKPDRFLERDDYGILLANTLAPKARWRLADDRIRPQGPRVVALHIP